MKQVNAIYRNDVNWLAARKKSVGASEVAALFDCSPWVSQLGLYERKALGDVQQGENLAMRFGQYFERGIVEAFGSVSGFDATPYTTERRVWRHECGLAATLDGVVWGGGLTTDYPLEAKNVSYIKKDEWGDVAYEQTREAEGAIPLHYQVQVQAQMLCTDADVAFLAALIGDYDFRWYRIEAHPPFQEKIVERVTEFWRRVEQNDPPEPDGSDDSKRALSSLCKEDSGEVVQLPPAFVELDQQREVLSDHLKRLNTEKQEIDNKIKAAIGTAHAGELPDAVYTLSRIHRPEYTVKASDQVRLTRKQRK